MGLIVEAADGSSSGWYQCTAVNVGGTAATRGKVLIDGGETSAAAVQRRQAERFEEVEERSERLDAIDAIEAKRRRVEAEQSRYKDFDDSFDSSRLSAIQLPELRREQANRKVERNTKERPQSSAISDLEFRLLAMEEERKQLIDNVNMDDKERLKSVSQLELRLAALEEERRKLREAHFDTGDRHGAVANLEARLQQIDAERAKLKEPHFDNRDRLAAYETLECQLQALETQQKALKNIDYGSSTNTEAINNLEKRLNMAEEERRKLHDTPEPEMDRIRRAIKRVEARRSIIEEQLHAVNTLPDEHRARSGAIAELELRLNEIEEDRKRLYDAPELSTQQEAIQNLEKHLKALEEQRQILLEVEDKSINLDAIEELEKQLKNVEEERKLAKEGPIEALESERKKAISELDSKLAKLEEERRILKEIPDHLSPHRLAITKLEKDLAENRAAQLKLKEGPDYGRAFGDKPSKYMPNYQTNLIAKLQQVSPSVPPHFIEENKPRDLAKTPQPKDEEPTENMFDANKKEPPVFKTNLKNAIVKEGQPGHLECRLIPIGDPSMKVEWFFNGKPIDIAHRFRMTYDFGYVALDMLYVYPEDSGEYRCVATNANGQAVTSCTVTCHQSSGIVTDTQLPEGHETVKKIIDMEEWMEAQRKAQFEFEDTDEPGIPLFPVPLSPVTIPEMDSAKFICKVKAFPAAKVHWFINGKMVVNSARYRITYDGMMHQLEIPQAKSWDEGEIKIVAKNKLGVGVSKTTLTLVERDDYRRVLKRNVECDTHLYYSRHGKYATENEELDKAYMEKQKKSFTIKQHEAKSSAQKFTMPELKHISRIEIHKCETKKEGIPRTPYQKRAPPMVKLGNVREKGKSAPPEGQYAINAMKHGLKKAGSVGADIVENFEALRLEKAQKEGRMDKNFRRDANLKHAEQVKHEIDKEQLPAFELQHAEIQTKEIKKSKLQIPELKSVPFEELEEREKIERGKVKYRAEMEPWVVGHIKDVNVKEGHPAKFMVEYRGNPIPEVTWFKEELEIQSSTQFQIMACDTHSYLFVPEVFTDDNGTYYAHVSNKMGEVRSKGLLQVEEEKQQAVPPKFDVRLIDKDIRIGEHIGELRVQVSGVPRPGIKWFKDGEPIEIDNKHYREAQDKNNYNLQLWNTTIDDKGVYECVAENKCGRTRCHCTIKMVEPIEDKPTDPKPILKSNPTDEKVREGEKITLTAVFEDLPEPPKATWYHNNQIIKKSKYFDIRRKGCVFTLTIVEAFVEDEGEYRCVVKNGGGEAEAKCQLFIEAPPPRILTDLVDQTILEGSDFTMEMKAIGEIAEYAWFKDGIIVKPCEEFQMS